MSFVDLASTFPCQVNVRKAETEVDGKSIMQMRMRAARPDQEGTRVVKDVAQQVGQQVRQAGEGIRQSVGTVFERGKNQAVDQADATAQALHRAAQDLEEAQPQVAKLTHSVAGQID